MSFQNVTIDKPLGQVLHIETEAGDINVKSLYVDATEFITKRGSVNIGSCHGDATVEIREKGNCTVGRLEESCSYFVLLMVQCESIMLLSHSGEYMANELTNAIRHQFAMIAKCSPDIRRCS